MPQARTHLRAANDYAKLEQRLVLLSWLNERLGYNNNRELLADIKQADEGFNADGHSHIYTRLTSRVGQLKEVSQTDLERYDNNIRQHLTAMNAGRRQPITLRYFQYLAALYTEIFLDWYFNPHSQLLQSLNELVNRRNTGRHVSEGRDEPFTESDLKKLAFWMATGSGKTLIMHINYRQFLHYNRKTLDNILLITPNEGLSEQHIAELQASNIRAARFDLNENSLLISDWNAVKVTEITKLVENKRGGGVSVPIESFEGNNLIFVDEGHKGSGGEAWRNMRDALGEQGFTFEYSATFGQALTAAGNKELIAEYGKAIVFDYSYRYFYDDGYGKDFHILNLQQGTTQDVTDTLLLANLLSFYEQHLVFAEHTDVLRPYNLDRPLWVFVGSSVNVIYTENKQRQSDVLTVVKFLHQLLINENWAIETIARLLEGQSDLRDPDGNDIFSDKFDYLHQHGMDASEVYRDILAKVMHTSSGGGLHLCDIRGSNGELGLKVGGAEDYFGLIYIGDTAAFKKMVTVKATGIAVEEDAFSDSLFGGINEPGTTIEMLIGARKFMEGWNSWRVSNMALLNIGRNEGSQIIQLFGRGVRLRGQNMTLRRSSALNSGHKQPDYIKLLETLNIFAVRANYMVQFQDYLMREGIETEGMLDLPLFIRPNRNFLDKGLVIPRLDDRRHFAADTEVLLEPISEVRSVFVDMSAQVQRLDSGNASMIDASASSGSERLIPPESLALVDWESVYLALFEYKEQKGWGNLIIRPDAPRNILKVEKPVYRLVADENLVKPRKHTDKERLQETVVSILRKYADALYRYKREQWESNHLVYKTLDESDPNFQFNVNEDNVAGRYIVSVQRSKKDLIREIEQLIANCHELYENETNDLPRIHFDRHLYQPLLVENEDNVKMSPPGLNEGEKRFVDDLRDYWEKEKDNSLADLEIFLLRNQSRGQGVGFFENSGFYPDFILWIKADDRQSIIFIEPHGMLNAPAYEHDDKAQLHERLPELAEGISQHDRSLNVSLNSFIISATSYEDLYKRYDDGSWDREKFAEAHILFPERNENYDYLAKILEDYH